MECLIFYCFLIQHKNVSRVLCIINAATSFSHFSIQLRTVNLIYFPISNCLNFCDILSNLHCLWYYTRQIHLFLYSSRAYYGTTTLLEFYAEVERIKNCAFHLKQRSYFLLPEQFKVASQRNILFEKIGNENL